MSENNEKIKIIALRLNFEHWLLLKNFARSQGRSVRTQAEFIMREFLKNFERQDSIEIPPQELKAKVFSEQAP